MEPTNARFVMELVTNNGKGYFCCKGGEDCFELVEICHESVIEWLRKQEWILDYNEVKDMTVNEITSFAQGFVGTKKMREIADYIKYLRGEIEFKFPEGVTPPTRELRKRFVVFSKIKNFFLT